MIERIKRWSVIFQEVVYHRSQEVRIPVKSLELSKDAENAHYVAYWYEMYLLRLMVQLLLLPVVAHAVFSSETFLKLIVGTATREEVANGAFLIGCGIFLLLAHAKPFQWKRQNGMVEFMREVRTNEQIGDLLGRRKWFYVTEIEVIFTNVRPWNFFRMADRFPTDYPWEKLYRRDFFTWLLERVFGGIYLRIMWPYFFNPIQLAFLEYDRAAKRIDLKSGQKVLVIGAGSVPHHIRWKKRLGPEGMITALDIDPYVLKDSERMERLIEWVRGIFGKRRWVSEHIPGDAAKLRFEAASFNAVIAVRCYFVSVDEALRVMKPNGKLLISTCGDVVELPERDDPRVESTFSGWVITNAA